MGAPAAEKGKAKPEDAPKAESLFNGNDLTGWEGDSKLWSVRDGMIVGKTSDADPLPYNKFLIWEGDPVENFSLTAMIRVVGENNSGIQYRSKRLPDLGEYVVGGYQMDIHPSQEYHGMLYEEKGRGISAKRGMKVVITPEGEKMNVGSVGAGGELVWGEWHKYAVEARGNQLVHKVDGEVTAKIFDHDAAGRALGGLIAFQVHKGNPMEVHIKEVWLKRLPAGGMIAPEKTPVPGGATPVMPPKPPKKPKGKKK